MEALKRPGLQLTEGSILRALLRLAGPVILSVTLQTSYQLVNTFWVGRLGAAAVAAVSVTAPLTFFLVVLGSGLSIAGAIFVAQFCGARRYDLVNHVAAQTILMVVLVSLGLGAVGVMSAERVLHWTGVGGDVLPSATSYLKIAYLGLPFSYGFMMFQSILQGVGEVRFPLYVVAASVVLNAVLDPLLIFGWGPLAPHGVVGAAIATISVQALAAFLGVGVLFTGRYGVRVTRRDFKPDPPFIRRALAVGLPASIEQSTRTLGGILLIVLAASFGTTALAAYGLGSRLVMFFFVPGLGLSAATATIVGQNIGAGRVDRAEQAAKLSAGLSLLTLTALGVLFYPFIELVARFLVPSDASVVELAASFVRIVAPAFGVIAAQQVLAGALRGAGQTVGAMVLSLANQWLLQIPLSYYLARYTSLGITGVWWGFPASNLLTLAMTLIWFRRGTWKTMRLTESALLTARAAEEAQVEEGTL